MISFSATTASKGKPDVIAGRGVQNGIAFANFKAHKFSYLNITSLGSDYVLDGKECGLACVNVPSCFSFNLAAFHDIRGRILCELLPSDKYNNSDKFASSQLFHHFSIGSPCMSGPCQNGGTCVSIYEKNSYVCLCTKGLAGSICQTGFFSHSAVIGGNVSYQSHLYQFLTSAVGFNPQWVLCYRASTHGWASSTFHSRCDGKNHTVTIIKNGQYVFGGYTDIPWDTSDTYGSTSNAFIFSLRNKEGLGPFKSMVMSPGYAIYRGSSYGPTFGAGWDIYIANNSNSNNNSQTFFGQTYTLPSGVQDRFNILAGTHTFTPDEVEVFYLI